MSDAQHAFSVLRNIRQKPDENVQLYAERVLALVPDAYGDHNNSNTRDLVESQLTNFFIDGLRNDQLRVKLMRDNPKSLADAVNTALAEQNLRKRVDLRAKAYSRPLSNPNHEPMDISMVRPPKRCYICKRPGHGPNQCRQSRRVNAASVDPKQNEQDIPSRNRDIQCWFCNKFGHMKRQCPDRLKHLRQQYSHTPRSQSN